MYGRGVGSDTGKRVAVGTAGVREVILGRGYQYVRPWCGKCY